jgi:hypothetical protein
VNRDHAILALAVAIVATTALTGETGLTSSPAGSLPAQADPCPPAVAIDALDDLEGKDLTGLTVERGTEPDGFTAEFLGVIENGIAPGLPMIVVDTSSDAPAAEMQKLLRDSGAAAAAPQVELTASLEAEIVDSGAATAREAAFGMQRLPLPIASSDTNPARLPRVTRRINRRLDNVVVYPAGALPRNRRRSSSCRGATSPPQFPTATRRWPVSAP